MTRMSIRAEFPGSSRNTDAGHAAMLGAMAGPLAHMLDVARFLPGETGGWSDALVSGTRRHLAGCLHAVERDFRAALGHGPAVHSPSTWDGVCAAPQIISRDLLAHMRCRAAVGLMGLQDGIGLNGAAAPPGEDIGWLVHDADAAIGAAALTLLQSERRWSVAGEAGLPADLPSEHYAELVWIVVALGVVRVAVQDMGALTDVALRLIAAHDEQQGPIAQADMLARVLGQRADADQMLGQSLAQRRLLLFAALAGQRQGMDCATMLDALVHASRDGLAGLCLALGGSASDYRHLLLQLKLLHSDWNDEAILSAAAAFDQITPFQAAATVGAFRCPRELRAKLELIGAMTLR